MSRFFLELTAAAVGDLVVLMLPHNLVQDDLHAQVCIDEPVAIVVVVVGCRV